MSVKSIAVKLVIPRSPGGVAIRRACAETHIIHNAGVRYFMENMLWLRQEDIYEDRDSVRPTRTRSFCQERLLRLAREVQRRNGFGKKASDPEILRLLRGVYEQIIPAAIGESSDNQAIARDWLGSLVSKASEAGLGKSARGRKPAWTELPDSDPRKSQRKHAYEERKKEQKSSQLRPRLKELGLLPLIPMFRSHSGYEWARVETKGKIQPWKDDNVSNWERDMFQQALERLSGWESWNKNAVERHRKAKETLTAWDRAHLQDSETWRPIFARYEASRRGELELGPLGLKRPFRIGRRMLRGWDRIREKWIDVLKKNHSISETDLLDFAKRWQQAHPREIGDMHFIAYLARPQNRAVWSGDHDYVVSQVHHNLLLIDSEEAHPWTILTLPHACIHPLWPRLDVPMGTNMNDYLIARGEDGGWHLTFSLLFPDGKRLTEKRLTLPVAHSGQLDYVRPVADSGRNLILRDPGTDEEFQGKWGGASVRRDRNLLQKLEDESAMRKAACGPVYISLTVDLMDRKGPSTKGFKKTPRGLAGEQFLIGIKEDSSANEILAIQNLGCLSIDLGLRQAAACSVFRMRTKPAQGRSSVPIAGLKRSMEHERSFLLALPGEQADEAVEDKRQKLWDELKKLSDSLGQLNRLIRLSGADGDSRSEGLAALEETETSIFDLKALAALKPKMDLGAVAWRGEVKRIHRCWEKDFAKALAGWRKSGTRDQKGRSRQFGIWGLSLEGIAYLERVRRLLIRWTTHPRKAEETNRLEKNRPFAARLQRHIDALKEDRIKKAADAVVMAALGYITEGEERKEKFEPCSIILVEDLERYRFRTDRPRQENSKLMQWAHRALFREIARQAGIFGIAVGKVGAGFTSRFHAATGAPGLRCAAVTKGLLRKPWFLKRLEEDGLDASSIQVGDIIPWERGKLFCTIDRAGKPVMIQADINAAQNLQKRFWANYDEPFRVVCAAGAADTFVPLPGKRLARFFASKMLAAVKPGDSPAYELVQAKVGRVEKQAVEEEGSMREEFPERLHEEDEAASARKTIFFRDPSGALLPAIRWYESKVFWSQVKQKVRQALLRPRKTAVTL